MTVSKPDFDAAFFRTALGRYATGVTVVTAADADGAPIGLTVSSFNSVSLNPPLVLWSLSGGSSSREAFERCDRYVVNVLSAHQIALARRFATGRTPDRFNGLTVARAPGGTPMLDGGAPGSNATTAAATSKAITSSWSAKSSAAATAASRRWSSCRRLRPPRRRPRRQENAMTTRRSRAQALSAAGAADERRHRLRRDRRGRGRPAIARALARADEVLVAEATEAIGTGTSSRNSEVIHAGIYYPAGSLKARLCVRGKHLLYAYCAERGVPHKRLGKLIVATDTAQAAQLEDIARRARANGVDDLQYISGEEAMRLEPALRCTAALLSPSTGIVDSHALMLSYQGDAENAGAQCVFHAAGIRARAARGRLRAAIRRRRRDAPELQHPDQRGRPAGWRWRAASTACRPPASPPATCARAAISRCPAARRSRG